jgi:hypothetical protein
MWTYFIGILWRAGLLDGASGGEPKLEFRPFIVARIRRIWTVLLTVFSKMEPLPRWILWSASFAAPILVMANPPVGHGVITIGAFALPLTVLTSWRAWNWWRGKDTEGQPSKQSSPS